MSVQTELTPRKSSWVGKRDNSRWSRNRRSMFQRCVCGVKKARFLHRQVWFITLTSSVESLEILSDLGLKSRDYFRCNFAENERARSL